MFEGWWVVWVASLGAIAAFPRQEDASDYADAVRDAIGEARGLTSAVSVRQWEGPAK